MNNPNADKETKIIMYFAQKEIHKDRRPILKKLIDRVKHDLRVFQERLSPIN